MEIEKLVISGLVSQPRSVVEVFVDTTTGDGLSDDGRAASFQEERDSTQCRVSKISQ